MHQSHPSLGIHTPHSQFQSQSVYIRFTHIMNMQPKFYVGSAMHHTLDREYSRSRKYLQLSNERLVQAELALRYWQEHDNLYIGAPIPIYTERADYRCLELALIQEWQPRLNYPFICQLFHPRKGIPQKPALNTNAQFGLATLWHRAKHKFTPQLGKDILASDRFQNRLELWTIIHALGSNTKARFEQTKMLRPHEGGLALCYALRRLASNVQEPFRTLSLQAIDTSIKWWQGKPAPRASALRSPWSLIPAGQSETAFPPCQIRTSPTCVTNCGLNIPGMSRVTSQIPPSPPSNRHLKVRSSIVKTSRPHLYGSIVLVSITRPLTIPSKIRPSLKLSLKIQRRLSHPLLTFNNNTAKHTHGQLVLDDNSQQGTFWQNERRRSRVVDPSYPLLILHFGLCSTSWPG